MLFTFKQQNCKHALVSRAGPLPVHIHRYTVTLCYVPVALVILCAFCMNVRCPGASDYSLSGQLSLEP